MSQRVSQRELRNDSGRSFVPAETALAAFARAPRIDRERFRREVDAIVDQQVWPPIAGLGDLVEIVTV